MESQDTFVDSPNTACYSAPAPGDIHDHNTPEERSAVIDDLNHSPKSGPQKLFAFLNRFGTVRREEFNQITGIFPGAEEWRGAASDDDVMDIKEARVFFDRGTHLMIGGKDARTDCIFELKYDKTMLLYNKLRMFLDEHSYFTREEFIYLSGQDIAPNEWTKYAGEDGKLDTTEFGTLAKNIFGFDTTPKIEGGTPPTGSTQSTPPGSTADKDKALYLQNLKEDNTILTYNKIPKFIERYGQITLEEFNYLSGKDVTPEEWKKSSGDDGKMDAGEYQKFSKAVFNIPEELDYKEKHERLKKWV